MGELAGLALPSGLGDQAPVIERGIDAIGLSSAGERPLPATADRLANLSTATLGDFGRAALLLAVTLDAAPGPPDHGPSAYVMLSGSLVPGWTLALLALTLTLPAGVASIDGLARANRRRRRLGRALRGLSPGACLRWRHCCSSTSSPGSGSWRSRLFRSTPAASGSARARSS